MLFLLAPLAKAGIYSALDQDFKQACFSKEATANPIILMLPGDIPDLSVVFKTFAQGYSNDSYRFAELNKLVDGQYYDKLYEALFMGADINRPFVGLYNHASRQKYVLPSPFSTQQLAQFIKGYEEGTLKPHMKSEIEPQVEKPHPNIKHLTGNKLEKVLQEQTEYFLMIHAPWCGHCKEFKPVLEQVAQLMSNNPNIVFAMLNGVRNDAAGLAVSGYPTVYWLGKGAEAKKTPVKYTGERKAYSVIDWIQTQTKNPWVEPLYSEEEEPKVEL